MRLSIAIPDTSLVDESTQLDKSRKISDIARACAIFKVDVIYIYDDGGSEQDKALLVTVLKYLETPAFLRKRLFPRINELKYAGVLKPLKIPSHITPTNPKKIRAGSIREGIVVSGKGRRFVDVGINQPVPYFGRKEPGKRTTVQFKEVRPEMKIKEITREEATEYWGYQIKERAALASLVSGWDGKMILTSRRGKEAGLQIIHEYAKTAEPVLVVFGSTDRGIHEILGGAIKQVQNARIVNFFPGQATETVRLEEAILGCLSILRSGL